MQLQRFKGQTTGVLLRTASKLLIHKRNQIAVDVSKLVAYQSDLDFFHDVLAKQPQS